MIHKLIWLNLVLVFITSGYIVTTYILYIASFVCMFMLYSAHLVIIEEYRINKKKGLPEPDHAVFVPDDFKSTRLNILCSTIIHLVIVFTQIGSIFICIGIILSTLLRLYSYNQLERHTNG